MSFSDIVSKKSCPGAHSSPPTIVVGSVLVIFLLVTSAEVAAGTSANLTRGPVTPIHLGPPFAPSLEYLAAGNNGEKCGHADVGTVPFFNNTTGRGGGGIREETHSCQSENSSEMVSQAGLELIFPLNASLGHILIATRMTMSTVGEWSLSLGTCGLAPGSKSSHWSCGAWSGFQDTIYTQIYDVTTSTVRTSTEWIRGSNSFSYSAYCTRSGCNGWPRPTTNGSTNNTLHATLWVFTNLNPADSYVFRIEVNSYAATYLGGLSGGHVTNGNGTSHVFIRYHLGKVTLS